MKVAALNTDKQMLRTRLLQKRAALSHDELNATSEAICRHLEIWLSSQKISEVFTYIPVRGEVDLRALKQSLPQVAFALPVTDEKQMNFFRWYDDDPLKTGRFGIPEPTILRSPMLPNQNTAILVPCLAASLSGVRLGYGGGFFDRYLARHKAVTVGVLSDAFVKTDLPRESHDRLLDWLVTNSGIKSVQVTSI
jgi:5-formyltetrahydrofolate cyclo-ligase